MRLHRFYTKATITIGEKLALEDFGLVNQVRNVFRMEQGDTIIIFNGDGNDYTAEILYLGKSEIELMPKSAEGISATSKDVTLFLALIKKDNFELAAAKAVEIGIRKIVPVLCERSEKKGINKERSERILIEASEQSGRSNIPELHEPIRLEELTAEIEPLFAADFGGKSIKEVSFPDIFGMLIGPEGGFSDKEREFLKKKGVISVSLGSTVLRAETAAIVMSAFVLS